MASAGVVWMVSWMGSLFLNMDGIGQLNAAGICVADLYRNILIIKVCVQGTASAPASVS